MSSAIAEMGDCLATIDMGRKVAGADVPLSVGELGSHLTQCCLGRGLPAYQVVSRSFQSFGHNRHGLRFIRAQVREPRKWGRAAVPLFVGELGPHLTQCGLRRSYLRAKCHLDPSSRLATIHQRYRQDTQRSDSIGRTVLQTVAQKPFGFSQILASVSCSDSKIVSLSDQLTRCYSSVQTHGLQWISEKVGLNATVALVS